MKIKRWQLAAFLIGAIIGAVMARRDSKLAAMERERWRAGAIDGDQ